MVGPHISHLMQSKAVPLILVDLKIKSALLHGGIIVIILPSFQFM